MNCSLCVGYQYKSKRNIFIHYCFIQLLACYFSQEILWPYFQHMLERECKYLKRYSVFPKVTSTISQISSSLINFLHSKIQICSRYLILSSFKFTVFIQQNIASQAIYFASKSMKKLLSVYILNRATHYPFAVFLVLLHIYTQQIYIHF